MGKLVIDVNNVNVGETIVGAFLIQSVDIKKTNAGKDFLDLNLVNRFGEINAKLWDCNQEIADKIIGESMLVIQGDIREWNGMKQISIQKFRQLKDEDGVPLSYLILSSSEDNHQMFHELIKYIELIKDKDLNLLVTTIVDHYKDKLLYYSGSKQHHHAYHGGLLEHTLHMIRDAISIVKNRKNIEINLDLLLSGIILHDIGKIKELTMDKFCSNREYSVSGELLGHITIGIKEIEIFAEKLNIDNYKKELVQHMLLSHHYEPEFGSPRRPMFIEAELLHYLDMLDTKLFMLNKIQNELNTNEFSQRQWSLDNRKIYRYKKS